MVWCMLNYDYYGEKVDQLQDTIEEQAKQLVESRARVEEYRARAEEYRARVEESRARAEESRARVEESRARVEEYRAEEARAREEAARARVEEAGILRVAQQRAEMLTLILQGRFAEQSGKLEPVVRYLTALPLSEAAHAALHSSLAEMVEASERKA